MLVRLEGNKYANLALGHFWIISSSLQRGYISHSPQDIYKELHLSEFTTFYYVNIILWFFKKIQNKVIICLLKAFPVIQI